ncbi:hypothetical protein RCL_jg7081.t1 [Rhizophagus clarus]|uniref:Uncharacterized protein n=1 Tax=Rhizophagus clarus TaxID=94130 RepID=A0A8H3M423_9GLOM|nr:hypothetical protein RCL_jg7081.t1 [Rhizophagus clarus]
MCCIILISYYNFEFNLVKIQLPSSLPRKASLDNELFEKDNMIFMVSLPNSADFLKKHHWTMNYLKRYVVFYFAKGGELLFCSHSDWENYCAVTDNMIFMVLLPNSADFLKKHHWTMNYLKRYVVFYFAKGGELLFCSHSDWENYCVVIVGKLFLHGYPNFVMIKSTDSQGGVGYVPSLS